MSVKNADSCNIGTKIGIIDISDTGKVIKSIAGFNAENCRDGCFFQVISLGHIASEEQLFFAAEQAYSAFARGNNFSKSPALEFLARCVGTRQIGRATEILELKKGKNEIALVCAVEKNKNPEKLMKDAALVLNLKEKKGLIEKNFKKNKTKLQKFFGISDAELKACADLENPLKNLILERVAFVSLEESNAKK